jgi:hypothetical protein
VVVFLASTYRHRLDIIEAIFATPWLVACGALLISLLAVLPVFPISEPVRITVTAVVGFGLALLIYLFYLGPIDPGSAAFLLLMLIIASFTLAGFVSISATLLPHRYRLLADIGPESIRINSSGQSKFQPLFWEGVVVTILVLALALPAAGAEASSRVRDGEPVIEYTRKAVPRLWPITLLNVHADPVIVDVITAPGQQTSSTPRATASTSILARLKDRKVFYLGRANSVIVLYDPELQEAVHLPQDSVVLRVTNCRFSHPPEETC